MSDKVNPNAQWDAARCEELGQMERLVREVSAINNGNRCLERIAECIATAESLNRSNRDLSRSSFLSFLNELAIKDRFGNVNEK